MVKPLGFNITQVGSTQYFGRLPRGPPQVHKMRRSVLSAAEESEASKMAAETNFLVGLAWSIADAECYVSSRRYSESE